MVCSPVNAQIILPTELIAWAEGAEDASGDTLDMTHEELINKEQGEVVEEQARAQAGSDIVLDGIFVSMDNAGQNIDIYRGNVRFIGGGNYLYTHNVSIYAMDLVRSDLSRSTFFYEKLGNLIFERDVSKYAINDGGGIAIIPWAVVNNFGGGDDLYEFAAIRKDHRGYHLEEMNSAFLEGRRDLWNSAANGLIGGGISYLGGSKVVNSLTLWNSGDVNFNGESLTINSGGLIHNGGHFSISGGAGSRITTAKHRPLYIHGQAPNLDINGEVKLTGGMDIVKTGEGILSLNSSVTHDVGAVYIHQGVLDLKEGVLFVSGPITVGDGLGTDKLRLAGSRRNQIQKRGGGHPTIILSGNESMQEGGGAVLEMGGGTQLELAKLHIEKQGVIDWVGGYDKAANILWLDELTFSGPDAKLFMKNWREYEDILLVRKSSFDFARLNNISFEGYKGPTKWREYDKDFIEITPFIPEPATYGAILGALGVAVVAWRRRRANEASRRPFHRRDGVVASLDAVEATAQ